MTAAGTPCTALIALIALVALYTSVGAQQLAASQGAQYLFVCALK